jgi:glycosyltransferase involved in cell wall biosynthesis
MVLTVGNVDRSNLTRKGHEPFVRAASLLPDVKFVLAGAWRDNSVRHLQRIAPANVCFTGWVEDSALADLYARSSAYVQLSCHEGFGMSVAEAMLAGSIPIVSKVGSLPEVVGDVGRFVVREDPAAVAGAIRDVLASSTQARKAVRNRILLNFSVEKRQKALWRIIDELLNVLCY